MRARMNHQIGDVQRSTMPQLLNENLQRLPPQSLVRGSQVDQVAVMSYDGIDPRLSLVLPKTADFSLLQHAGPPLSRTPGEDLDGVTSDFMASEDSLIHAPSNGDMGTKRHCLLLSQKPHANQEVPG